MNAEVLLKMAWQPNNQAATSVSMTQLFTLRHTPILLLDGHYGLLIIFDDEHQQVGAQVPGEETIRYLPLAAIERIGNAALIEMPTFRCDLCHQLKTKIIRIVDDDAERTVPVDLCLCPSCYTKASSPNFRLVRTIEGRAYLA